MRAIIPVTATKCVVVICPQKPARAMDFSIKFRSVLTGGLVPDGEGSATKFVRIRVGAESMDLAAHSQKILLGEAAELLPARGPSPSHRMQRHPFGEPWNVGGISPCGL